MKIKVNENLEVEYSEELNKAISELAILIGDDINSLQPLEKFYALRTMCEEIEARCMFYTAIQGVNKS